MKTNMKRIICIALCMITCIATFGQKDAQAKKVLDATSSKIMAMKDIKANFKISGNGSSTSGTICISGKKYKVSTSEMSAWFDGKSQWTYLTSDDEVTITSPTKAEQASLNPYAFLTLYKQGFNYTMKRNNKSYEVHLTAQSKNSNIQEMKVTITSDYRPTSVSIKQGKQWLTIGITSIAGNQNFAAGLFTFPSQKYKNAEIIDLR